MSIFRTMRPLIVDARQWDGCEKIVSSADGRTASRGDWIVKGENGETFLVDNAFFQRTFTPFDLAPERLRDEEGRHYGC